VLLRWCFVPFFLAHSPPPPPFPHAAETAAAVAAYRASIVPALSARPSAPDDCYVIQYVPFLGGGGEGGGSAALSARFLGKPVLAGSAAAAGGARVGSFEYAPALPAFLPRMAVQAAGGGGGGAGGGSPPAPASPAGGASNVLVMGDEPPEVEAVASPAEEERDDWVVRGPGFTDKRSAVEE
jgi:hypothetical protein